MDTDTASDKPAYLTERSVWQYPKWLRLEHQPFWRAPAREFIRALVIGEAARQGSKGMLAVACVLRNRVQAKFRGSSYQECGLWKKQFSCFWAGFPKRQEDMERALVGATDPRPFRDADDVAVAILDGCPDITHGATYYVNPKLCNPEWLEQMEMTLHLGDHAFFKPKTTTRIR